MKEKPLYPQSRQQVNPELRRNEYCHKFSHSKNLFLSLVPF
jgi:hypothetical protein